MTGNYLSKDAEGTAPMPKRMLLVFMQEVDTVGFARAIRLSAGAAGLSELSVEAFQSTMSYQPDPNRPQQFISAAAAIQIDYNARFEPTVIGFMHNLDLPMSSGVATISIGTTVRLLKRSGSNLLLLGARRKTGLTPEQFGQYWTQEHAPRAVGELREASVPIGYEIFLADHDLSSAGSNRLWQPSDIDGWMHITTGGPADFANLARNAAHRAWVLEDERNFVNFAAPMFGQQMLSLHQTM